MAAANDPRLQALDNIRNEMVADMAANLGRLGRALEEALAAVEALPADAAPETRRETIDVAARACWRYFIQRESCGMRDHARIIRDYRIPGRVLARVGATV